MTHLRAATWVLFIVMALANAAWAWVAFSHDMPFYGALSSVAAVCSLAAATILHLFINAYQVELKKLTIVNSGIERLTSAVLERRKQSGPESPH